MIIERQGKVSIEKRYGSYRLRYRVDGAAKTLTVAGGATKTTLVIARKMANEINLDLATGNYDTTRAKYAPRYRKDRDAGTANLLSLWEKYKDARTGEVSQHRNWDAVDRALSKVSPIALNLGDSVTPVKELKVYIPRVL